MSQLITSAYDGNKVTVNDLMADPTFIPTRIIEDLEKSFVEDLFFRKAQGNNGVVAFREAAGEYLADDAEVVSEFGEIPVSAPELGDLYSAFGVKTGEGIRVSWEQRNENKLNDVQRNIAAAKRNVVRHGYLAVTAALDKAKVPELQVSTAWASGGDPAKDILDAIEAVQGAHEEGNKNRVFDYVPDTILLSPQAYTKIIRNEQVQKFFIGNAALENPVFKGLTETTLFGLRVATSRLMPNDELYLLEAGTVGFTSDSLPLSATPLYSEGGDSPLGGPTMSWRSDIVRKRAIGVDNPKAALKVKGF